MADATVGWKVILAYVCIALGAALLLFGFIRLIYFCIVHKRDKKEEELYYRNLRSRQTLALDKDGKLIRQPANLPNLDGAAIYSQPSRPSGGANVNAAIVYEDANPYVPERLYHEHDGDRTYDSIERTLNIERSGTTTPASIRSSNQPHSSRSAADRDAALDALDQATAGESTTNTPRSLSDKERKDSVYMVTGDRGPSIIQLPRTNSTLSNSTNTYRTYSHEPLPIHKEIEHDYTFVTSFH